MCVLRRKKKEAIRQAGRAIREETDPPWPSGPHDETRRVFSIFVLEWLIEKLLVTEIPFLKGLGNGRQCSTIVCGGNLTAKEEFWACLSISLERTTAYKRTAASRLSLVVWQVQRFLVRVPQLETTSPRSSRMFVPFLFLPLLNGEQR